MKYSLAAMVLVGLASAEQLQTTNLAHAEPEGETLAKPADADAKTAPKMVVVHKADDKKAETPKVHTIITRPAAKHADPSTKAH